NDHAVPSRRSAPAIEVSAACRRRGRTPPKGQPAPPEPPRHKLAAQAVGRIAYQVDLHVEAASHACGDNRSPLQTRRESALSPTADYPGIAPRSPTPTHCAPPCSAASSKSPPPPSGGEQIRRGNNSASSRISGEAMRLPILIAALHPSRQGKTSGSP